MAHTYHQGPRNKCGQQAKEKRDDGQDSLLEYLPTPVNVECLDGGSHDCGQQRRKYYNLGHGQSARRWSAQAVSRRLQLSEEGEGPMRPRLRLCGLPSALGRAS